MAYKGNMLGQEKQEVNDDTSHHDNFRILTNHGPISSRQNFSNSKIKMKYVQEINTNSDQIKTSHIHDICQKKKNKYCK